MRICLSSSFRSPRLPLRPRIIRARHTRLPLLQNNTRRTLTSTAFNSVPADHDITQDVVYIPIEGVERLEWYRPGGYHPIQIGDQLHGRYQVVHKLGHGSYSTSWLARDEQAHKYVAVKVCVADSISQELDILSSLTGPQSSVDSAGKTMVPSVLDQFKIQGPNGIHVCYITASARGTLSDMKDGSWIRLFRINVARALAAQLVLVVDYIHAQGVVHGDLHMGNILLNLPSAFDHLSLDQLYKQYGGPEPEPVVHMDGKALPPGVPSHGILPIWLGEASENITLKEASILLTDFGEAFSYPKSLRYISHTPLPIRPPETRFEPTKPLSPSSDIWSLACTIWSIIAQRPLFESFFATEDLVTREQVDTLGILPPEWWKRWEGRQDKFTGDGMPINRNPFRSWEDRFEDSIQQPRKDAGMPLFDMTEKKAISQMLRPMLAYRPEDRPSTKDILESKWMVEWALPEFEKVGKHC